MFISNQILPAFILVFLNLKLIQRVQHSNRYTLAELVARQHNHLTSSMPIIHPRKQKRLRDEHRLTKTLVAVVLIFLICNTFTIITYPPLVQKLTSKKYPAYIYTGFRIQKLITNIMLLLNYSINFFLYCAFNQKFLDTLKLTFRHGLCSSKFSHHQNDSITTQRMLFNSTTSSVNSSLHLQPKIHNSSKNFSNFDEDDIHPGKQFSLKTFKDAL
jgi:hypothetical protein